jgi:hypothetical protein
MTASVQLKIKKYTGREFQVACRQDEWVDGKQIIGRESQGASRKTNGLTVNRQS